jgi:purine-binding chemotaxis protein CheW
MTQALVSQTQGTILLATFFVRDTLCALDAAGVQEVMRLARLTSVRHAIPEVLGVINMRGRIVTILDIGLRLGFDKAISSPHSRVFIVENRSEFIGLLVDRVAEVVEVERASLEPTPANISSGSSRFFKGVFRNGGRVTTLVDVDQVLADESTSAR